MEFDSKRTHWWIILTEIWENLQWLVMSNKWWMIDAKWALFLDNSFRQPFYSDFVYEFLCSIRFVFYCLKNWYVVRSPIIHTFMIRFRLYLCTLALDSNQKLPRYNLGVGKFATKFRVYWSPSHQRVIFLRLILERKTFACTALHNIWIFIGFHLDCEVCICTMIYFI